MSYGIILAAGKGTRMKSELPKCVHKVLGKPMVEYVVDNMLEAGINELYTVIGYKGDEIIKVLEGRSSFVYQTEQLGTGHAVMQAIPKIKHKPDLVVIAFGDVPMISTETYKNMMSYHKKTKSDLTLFTAIVENSTGYGRIVRGKNNEVLKIVEEKDASQDEKKIKEVNASLYILESDLLIDALNKIDSNNAQKEYYLTDIVDVLVGEGKKVSAYICSDNFETKGINDRGTLNEVENQLIERINGRFMEKGVLLTNPSSIVIGPDVVIDETAHIYPNTVILGKTIIKGNTYIGPNSELENVIVDVGSEVKHSVVHDSKIMGNSTVGPFAHIRAGSQVGTNNRIGNFVEMKATSTKANTKAAHLSYIGDAEVGEGVNFGCGTVTVNYDGVNKYKTYIEDKAFIGCNSSLVAPITIGEEAYIAAGSTITKDVPKGALAIARGKQQNKEGYVSKLKNKMNQK